MLISASDDKLNIFNAPLVFALKYNASFLKLDQIACWKSIQHNITGYVL